jgi:hypothetical protein
MFTKIGELASIDGSSIQSEESVFSDPSVDERFKKFAGELRRVAPKANDFLYFSAVMLHSAEAALVNPDGTPKLNARGEQVKAHWEKKGDSWKWVCSDAHVRPLKNSNGDIFPEEELLRAYKLWIGKPLCVDHKSSQVDAIRGVILDTYYDRTFKRVIGLCALDKVSYPELARGISTGYKTSVSMGTAVGRAICTDCGTVARTEHDFCSHMRSKSCYGEINCDLQPIELSIVVNGADPQAKIRTILAHAQEINNALDDSGAKINQMISEEINPSNKINQMIGEEVSKPALKAKIDALMAEYHKLKKEIAELEKMYAEAPDTNTATDHQSCGTESSPVDETNQESFGLNFPQRLASNNNILLDQVKNLMSSVEGRLNNMENALNTLTNKEDTMSKDAMNKKEAYFQGAGGVNEPTPGQKKYPVDPANEKLRMEDKHMKGEPPFPEVGAVDGLHPSPESADQKDELERKKMLARAERRNAALQKAKENVMKTKEAYWNGGGGVNEPTPGKQKYPVDNLEYELREKEDKQMVGQKPFPGVGDVEGLHPSPLSADQKDELARKKLLQRASLKARFVRTANTDGTNDLGNSAWQVFAKSEDGEKLVFTASVDEITGGRSDVLFDVVATKEFGTKMLEKIRTVGFEQATAIYKKGQAVAAPGGQPGAADVGGAGATPAMPDMGAPAVAGAPPADAKPEDQGGKGDPKDTAMKLAESVRDKASDLLEAIRSLTGEQSQMGDMEQGLEAMPKAASELLAPMYKSRRELNAALLSGAKKSLAELKEHHDELKLIASIIENVSEANKDYADTVVDDAFEDAKKACSDAETVLKSFAAYVRGVAGLAKRAEEAKQASLFSFADDDMNDARKKAKKDKEEKAAKEKAEKEEKEEAEKEEKEDEDEDKSDADDTNAFMGDTFEQADKLDHTKPGDDSWEMPGAGDKGDYDDDKDVGLEDLDLPTDEHDDLKSDDQNDTMVDLPAGAAVPAGAKAVENKMAFDLTTKEGRTAYRAKLAADATGKEEDGEIQSVESMKHSDMLDEANKLTDGQTQLDVKPSDSLGLIETKPEQQKADLEVARAEPKVRKEAERLNQLIAEGKVKTENLDALIAQGLDSEVVKYWRQYYGQAGKEGSEFGKLLTTETMKAKAQEEVAAYKVKLGRAYELANEMVRRGLCEDERAAIAGQVDQIMTWNDEGFESMKRVIAKHAPKSLKKQAMPVVGLQSEEMFSSETATSGFQDELANAFSGRKY